MKKKRRLKKSVKIALIVITVIILPILIWGIQYNLGLRAVDKNGKSIKVTIESGDSYTSIGSFLKEQKLIRSELCYKIYIKTHDLKDLVPGTYTLNQAMDVPTIIKTLGSKSLDEAITFREGLNVRQIAQIVEEKLNIKSEDFIAVLSDSSNLDKWISKYWFLTNDIKNSEIYYPLEGYLFPDTYHFDDGTSAIEVIEKMLDNTEKRLEEYKNAIITSSYSVHDIITMSSILELEVSSASDRNGVVSVFYNRINNDMPLQADATTYYAEKLELHERDLYQSELDSCNAYNTRCQTMLGLPVGPICNPGLESIEVTLNPTESDYLYYVADNQGKTYFARTYSEHNKNIEKLKAEGLFERW